MFQICTHLTHNASHSRTSSRLNFLFNTASASCLPHAAELPLLLYSNVVLWLRLSTHIGGKDFRASQPSHLLSVGLFKTGITMEKLDMLVLLYFSTYIFSLTKTMSVYYLLFFTGKEMCVIVRQRGSAQRPNSAVTQVETLTWISWSVAQKPKDNHLSSIWK